MKYKFEISAVIIVILLLIYVILLKLKKSAKLTEMNAKNIILYFNIIKISNSDWKYTSH